MSTIEQLKSFGKVKNSYAGLSTHDDIAITVLFASRFFDAEDKYFEWLDEWFGILP
jgi:predicted aldo/keto reductase-like oxidoreductase